METSCWFDPGQGHHNKIKRLDASRRSAGRNAPVAPRNHLPTRNKPRRQQAGHDLMNELVIAVSCFLIGFCATDFVWRRIKTGSWR
jgi:hypothetical protein